MAYLSYSPRSGPVVHVDYPSSLPCETATPATTRTSIEMAYSVSILDRLVDPLYDLPNVRTRRSSSAHTFGSSMRQASTSTPNAYVSDADLLGDDDAPYMSEPPTPPRSADAWMQAVAKPLLPPVLNYKPRAANTNLVSPSKKTRRTSSAATKSSKG